jgi:transposase-like protein
MEKESLVALLGQGLSVEKIARRFGKHPSTVAYWVAKHGLVAPMREQHAAKGGIERERLEALVEKYSRCIAALEFHHMDPLSKRLGISRGGLTLSAEAVRAEAAKCVLLCSNCHAEVESGLRPLIVE